MKHMNHRDMYYLQSGDAFGSDPFAPAQSTLSSTHPRPRRVKSPAPAPPKSPAPSLPPKQKKMPPPRPPAPKSKSPVPGAQSKSSTPDPFGGGSDPFGGMDPFGPPSLSSATSSQDPFGGSLNLPGNDPFSNGSQSMTSAGGDPFANFADFSPSKVRSKPEWVNNFIFDTSCIKCDDVCLSLILAYFETFKCSNFLLFCFISYWLIYLYQICCMKI